MSQSRNKICKGDVAIIIGHTKLKPGACSPFGIPCEFQWNNGVVQHLKDVADVYHYGSYNFGYKSMVKTLAKKINAKNYKLVLELHYNGAASRQANGTEALYYFSNKKAKAIANDFCEKVTKKFGTKNRGAKARYNSKQRGFYALAYPKPTTLILEPFFGSSKTDTAKFRGNEKMYADVLVEVIQGALND